MLCEPGQPVLAFLLLTACRPDDGEVVFTEVIAETEAATLTQIAYGSDGLRIEAHVAQPTGDGPFPVLLFNHEGFKGLQTHRRDELLDKAGALGVAVFASSYRGEDASWGEIEYCHGEVRDVLNLLTVAETWGRSDLSRLATGGWSHGACISLMATRASDRFAGSVANGTPTDIDALIQWHHDEGNRTFAEEWEAYVGNRGEEMSPLHQPVTPPALLLHGLEDDVVPLDQACMMLDDYAPDGAPLGGTVDDCQGEVTEGAFWDDPALDEGLVLVSYAGVGHQPDWRMWEHFWERVADLLEVSAEPTE